MENFKKYERVLRKLSNGALNDGLVLLSEKLHQLAERCMEDCEAIKIGQEMYEGKRPCISQQELDRQLDMS